MMRLFMLVLLGVSATACTSEIEDTSDTRRLVRDETSIWNTLTGEPPQVIAHRGFSGIYPEHSTLAYLGALDAGADILEPDLQVSADGVLIVRHDAFLSGSSDVEQRTAFFDYRRERFGREDWWVADFTADELASLNVRQTRPGRDQSLDDQMPILTFENFLALVDEAEERCACVIPIEPEIKAPSAYALMGLDPLPILLETLDRHDLNRVDAPVVIQSFDAAFLQALNQRSDVRLAMLYSGPNDLTGNAGGLSLEEIAGFADVMGTSKNVLLNPDGSSTGYVEAAHEFGLQVHAWTVRDDEPPLVGESVEDELRALYALGVDAVFTDFPPTAVRVREEITAGFN